MRFLKVLMVGSSVGNRKAEITQGMANNQDSHTLEALGILFGRKLNNSF